MIKVQLEASLWFSAEPDHYHKFEFKRIPLCFHEFRDEANRVKSGAIRQFNLVFPIQRLLPLGKLSKYQFLGKSLNLKPRILSEMPPSFSGQNFRISYELRIRAKHSVMFSKSIRIEVPITFVNRTASEHRRVLSIRTTNDFDMLDFVSKDQLEEIKLEQRNASSAQVTAKEGLLLAQSTDEQGTRK